MSDSELKENQYNNAAKYSARVLIHAKFGTNKTPWPIWLFNLYHFDDHARIIEFGCGNGILWRANSFRINSHWQIKLTDFSQGMIDSAKNVIGPTFENIRYQVMDLSDFDVEDRKFSNVIANHMLYHMDDREKAIRSIYDILEPGGEFYASTIGMNNMQEMKLLVKEFTGNDYYTEAQGHIAERFSLENGAAQISAVFKNVEKAEYFDSLEVTDANDLANYVLSCNDLKPGVQVLPEDQKDAFAAFVEEKIKKNGKIHISKPSGTFIAKK